MSYILISMVPALRTHSERLPAPLEALSSSLQVHSPLERELLSTVKVLSSSSLPLSIEERASLLVTTLKEYSEFLSPPVCVTLLSKLAYLSKESPKYPSLLQTVARPLISRLKLECRVLKPSMVIDAACALAKLQVLRNGIYEALESTLINQSKFFSTSQLEDIASRCAYENIHFDALYNSLATREELEGSKRFLTSKKLFLLECLAASDYRPQKLLKAYYEIYSQETSPDLCHSIKCAVAFVRLNYHKEDVVKKMLERGKNAPSSWGEEERKALQLLCLEATISLPQELAPEEKLPPHATGFSQREPQSQSKPGLSINAPSPKRGLFPPINSRLVPRRPSFSQGIGREDIIQKIKNEDLLFSDQFSPLDLIKSLQQRNQDLLQREDLFRLVNFVHDNFSSFSVNESLLIGKELALLRVRDFELYRNIAYKCEGSLWDVPQSEIFSFISATAMVGFHSSSLFKHCGRRVEELLPSLGQRNQTTTLLELSKVVHAFAEVRDLTPSVIAAALKVSQKQAVELCDSATWRFVRALAMWDVTLPDPLKARFARLGVTYSDDPRPITSLCAIAEMQNITFKETFQNMAHHYFQNLPVPEENSFEIGVKRIIQDMGIPVTSQVQVGGYFIDHVASINNHRIALECDGEEFHYVNAKLLRLLGSGRLKVKYLTYKGFHVVRIPHFQWRTARSKRDYLRTKLFKPLLCTP